MKKTFLADLVLLGVTFSWGTTFVLVKEAINTMPPFTFIAMRFLIAALLLGLFMFAFFRSTLRNLNKDIWIAGTLLGFTLFLGYAFQTFGLQFTSASKSGFITGLSVVMVPFMALWMLKQKLKRNALLGVLVAAVGLGMLSLTRDLSVNIGDVLTFFCAVSFGLQVVLVGRYAPKYHAFPLALIQILTCGLFSLMGALLFEHVGASFTPVVLLNGWVLSALLVCSVIATAIAFAVQNQFQKYTTPTRTALVFSTEPVFAALIGYFWENDHLNAMQIIGCLLILAGMLIAEIGGNHEDSEQPEVSPS